MEHERHEDEEARAARIAALIGGLDTPAPRRLRAAVEAAVAEAGAAQRQAPADAPVAPGAVERGEAAEGPLGAPAPASEPAAPRSRARRGRRGWPSLARGASGGNGNAGAGLLRGRRFALGGGLLAAVAAAVIAIVLVTGGGGSPPAVPAVAEAALSTPTEPVPAATHDGKLAVETDGVYFPDWSNRAGGPWQAVGERNDRVGDRDVRTVVYRNGDGAQVHYAIASGDALPFGAGSRFVTRNGVRMWVYDLRDGGSAVMWLRDGHTCVVTSRGLRPDTLISLVSSEAA
jgi:hypothetical protein